MKFKDIKVGETYNVRVKVIGIAKNGADAIYVDDEGIAGLHIGKRRVGILRPISPENGIKNTESALKYDQCRKFRKGDKVSPLSWNDRPPTAYDINEITAHFIPEKGLYSVSKDELPDSTVLVDYKGKIITMQACHLELVTPAAWPFTVEGDADEKEFSVMLGTRFVASFPYGRGSFYTHDGAKAAAEDECARLNAEYRKEME